MSASGEKLHSHLPLPCRKWPLADKPYSAIQLLAVAYLLSLPTLKERRRHAEISRPGLLHGPWSHGFAEGGRFETASDGRKTRQGDGGQTRSVLLRLWQR